MPGPTLTNESGSWESKMRQVREGVSISRLVDVLEKNSLNFSTSAFTGFQMPCSQHYKELKTTKLIVASYLENLQLHLT